VFLIFVYIFFFHGQISFCRELDTFSDADGTHPKAYACRRQRGIRLCRHRCSWGGMAMNMQATCNGHESDNRTLLRPTCVTRFRNACTRVSDRFPRSRTPLAAPALVGWRWYGRAHANPWGWRRQPGRRKPGPERVRPSEKIFRSQALFYCNLPRKRSYSYCDFPVPPYGSGLASPVAASTPAPRDPLGGSASKGIPRVLARSIAPRLAWQESL